MKEDNTQDNMQIPYCFSHAVGDFCVLRRLTKVIFLAEAIDNIPIRGIY